MQATTGLRARAAVAIIAAVCAGLLAIPAGVVLLRPHHPPKLTEESLARSVREDAGWDEAGCVQHEGIHWGCRASSSVSSGDGVVYDVRMTSGHCWTARAVQHSGTATRLTASGCL
jgi:hypothetical protein